jgi:hypothetical protein
MTRRALGRSTWMLLGALLSVPAGAFPASAQGREDPLTPFLRGMADSTDAFFGRTAVAFDTTGIDSLIRVRSAEKPTGPARVGASIRWFPNSGYHRATGSSVGAGAVLSLGDRVRVETRGSYGIADQQGRYRAALAGAVLRPQDEQDGGRLWLVGSYARETLSFAPEHAKAFESSVVALTTGRDRQSVFERHAAEVALRWEGGSTLGEAGWRTARDRSMATVTRFSWWGTDRDVAPVAPARGGAYHEGFVEVAHATPGSSHLGAEARYASRQRWRARVAGAHRLGIAGFEVNVQAEAGLAARRGPAQDRFELGGPVAIPWLRRGEETGNRLGLGKVELIRAVDLLRALRVPHPSFLVLHPALFLQGGAVWTDRDGSWDRAPRGSERGAAGFELIHLPGIPNAATFVRLQMVWPLGRHSGVPRVSMALGRWHDLAPRR